MNKHGNCKTNVPRNDDICKLFQNEIGLNVTVIPAQSTLEKLGIEIKQNYLANIPRQITHMRENSDQVGRNGIEGEEVCISV